MATPARRVGVTPDEDLDTSSSNDFEVPGKAAASIDPATVLADIAADLAEKGEAEEPISLAVPMRPDYLLQFRINIDFDDLRLWIQRAKQQGKGKKASEDPHALRLAFAVLSNTNTGMTHKGRVVTAMDGRPMTLNHPEFAALLKVPIGGVPAVIRKFYKADGHIILTMRKVVEEAGYTDEVDLEGDGPLES